MDAVQDRTAELTYPLASNHGSPAGTSMLSICGFAVAESTALTVSITTCKPHHVWRSLMKVVPRAFGSAARANRVLEMSRGLGSGAPVTDRLRGDEPYVLTTKGQCESDAIHTTHKMNEAYIAGREACSHSVSKALVGLSPGGIERVVIGSILEADLSRRLSECGRKQADETQ
jgi:hypothetical protein